MLQDQLRYGILIALIAVGLFCRGMLCQQNNEGPSSSHNFGPTSSDSANSQRNDIQADGAAGSNFVQMPILGEAEPNIQQDKANSQHNSIQAKSAKNSNFYQVSIVGKATHPLPINFQQDLLSCRILIGSMAMGLLGLLVFHRAFIAARLLGFFRGMVRQQKNEGPSSSNSQNNAMQTSSGPASKDIQPDVIKLSNDFYPDHCEEEEPRNLKQRKLP